MSYPQTGDQHQRRWVRDRGHFSRLQFARDAQHHRLTPCVKSALTDVAAGQHLTSYQNRRKCWPAPMSNAWTKRWRRCNGSILTSPLVEMRFFGGLTERKSPLRSAFSERTVRRRRSKRNVLRYW